ncbi:ATP synthase F1 subunit delta [Patescibacteria group bacterium]|nr:ATP synthase F1 subunit delta [Patescibacteria group bacterium]
MGKKASQNRIDIANAAITVAKEQNQVQRILDDIDLFTQIINQNQNLIALLDEISIPLEKRITALNSVGKKDFHEISLNTLSLLIQNGLISEIKAFNESLIQSAREIANHHECLIKSAIELKESQKQDIITALEKRFNGTVRAKFVLDPTILGGIEIACGDWRYLSTLQSKIQQLHKHLITSQ